MCGLTGLEQRLRAHQIAAFEQDVADQMERIGLALKVADLAVGGGRLFRRARAVQRDAQLVGSGRLGQLDLPDAAVLGEGELPL